MQRNIKYLITVATSAELMNEHYYRRLWIATKNIGVLRRDWLDELANTFRDYNGMVLHPSGELFDMPFVDDVFGNDPDMRWLGYFMASNPSGNYPQFRTRKLGRLQILDLYFRIKHPDLADKFKD
ncbi:MAG: hypothetical protein ACRBBR_06600 [Cellvibrionaceae bacterium]